MEKAEIDLVDVISAARLSGLSLTMITYLGRIGVLKATGHGSSARGKRRMFTFTDVLFLRVIAQLLARGIEVKRLAASLRHAKAKSEEWEDIRKAPGKFLVTDGTEVFVRKKGQLESKTFNGQFAFAFVVDLQETDRTLRIDWTKLSLHAA